MLVSMLVDSMAACPNGPLFHDIFPLEAFPGATRTLTTVKAELPDGATAEPGVSCLQGLCGSVCCVGAWIIYNQKTTARQISSACSSIPLKPFNMLSESLSEKKTCRARSSSPAASTVPGWLGET